MHNFPHQFNKLWKFLRECPLISLILLSVAGYTLYAIAGGIGGEFHLRISKDHTLFMSAMIKEDPFLKGTTSIPTDIIDSIPEKTATASDATTSGATPEATPSDTVRTDGSEPIPTTYETVPMRYARSAYYEDNDQIACTTNYDYISVDAHYFDDAVFIGDSRIEGLHDYGTLRINSSADFYYKDGISIWDLMEKPMANGETVPYALAAKQYKKIYIMCGVNELGTGHAKDYQAQYKRVLDQIQELQPDAVIFIMGMMHVTQSYADKSDVYNNDNIDCRNALIAQYADGQHIFYLDMNPTVCDMDGTVPLGIKSDYSHDGVHLQAQYYALWEDYLLQHGVSDNIFTNLQKQQ